MHFTNGNNGFGNEIVCRTLKWEKRIFISNQILANLDRNVISKKANVISTQGNLALPKLIFFCLVYKIKRAGKLQIALRFP